MFTLEDREICKNCEYKNYCKMIIADPFIYKIDGKEFKKDEFINYVIFKMKVKENDNHIPHID